MEDYSLIEFYLKARTQELLHIFGVMYFLHHNYTIEANLKCYSCPTLSSN